MTKLSNSVCRIFFVAFTIFFAQSATALEWPERAVRVIVPFSPGSAVDTIPRLVFEQLASSTHQPVVVENRPGAGGLIGSNAVARSAPDGYTLLATTSSHTIAPLIHPAASYDPANTFAGVIALGTVPNVLVVAPNGFKTLDDLMAAARAKPGTMTFASAGLGSATHFSAERFRLSARLDLIHVPFKGAAEAYTEVMTGRVNFYFGALSSALPFIHDGKLVALAVNSRSRAAALPDVPTTLEAGYANSDYTFWISLFVPRRTPAAVVEEMHERIRSVLESSQARDQLTKQGVEPMTMSCQELDELVKAELLANRELIKAANIRSE